MKVRFLSIAATELDDAFSYYENIYQGLGKRFIEEFELALSRVTSNPLAWQKLSKYTHRCLVNKFPYSIVYRFKPDEILIVAIANNHQRPNYWVKRNEN